MNLDDMKRRAAELLHASDAGDVYKAASLINAATRIMRTRYCSNDAQA